jgi:hypothetical protein
MDISLLLHHKPSLRQRKDKSICVGNYCPLCGHTSKSNFGFLRVNLRIKVFKCCQCGSGGRNIKSFIKQIKEYKKNSLASLQRVSEFEIQKCPTFEESELPF